MSSTVRINIVGTDAASPVFDRVAASADRAASRIMAAGKRMNEAGKTLTHTLTLPIVGAVGASADLATRFQAAMEKIHTQAGGSQADVRKLSAEVLNLGKSSQFGPIDLANSLYHLKSVGMDNTKAMQALGQAQKLAAVGGANLEETTNALAGAWRTGISGATSFHQAVATVNAIIGAGNMRMEDFNAAIGTGILPAAKTFGLSLSQVGSALALLTDEGVPATDAATRLRMSFSLLGAPSGKAEKVLKSIGITGLQLATTMRHPGTGLIDALSLLKDKLDKSGLSAAKQSQILSHAFGGGRSSATIMSLLNNLDVLKKKQDQVNKSMGKFGDAVAKQAQTAQAKFKTMVASLETAAIRVGNIVLPWLTKLANKISDMAQKFDDLPAHTQKMILVGALIVAGVGPALRILGSLVTLVGLLAKTGFLLGAWAGTAVRAAYRVIAGFALLNVSTAAYGSTAFQMGFRARAAFQGLGSAGVASLKLLGSAVGGAAIGYGLGQISKRADTTTKVLDTLGGAAAGAALGLAVGGPLGAAIGGVTGLLGGLAANFLHAGKAADLGEKAAQAALLQQKQDARDLLGVLQQVNGAYSATYEQQLVDKLGARGVLDIASKAGVDLRSLVDILEGKHNGAFGWAQLNAQLENAAAKGKITFKQMDSIVGVMQHMAPAVAAAEHNFELEQQALGRNAVAAKYLGVSVKDLSKAFGGMGRDLGDVSAAGQRNRAVLGEEADALKLAAARAIAHGQAVDKVTARYKANMAELKAHLVQMGFDKTAVQNLIAQYEKTPPLKVTKFLADIAPGKASAQELQRIIDAVKQNHIPWLRANTLPGQQAIAALQNAIDRLHNKTLYINVRTNSVTSYAPQQNPGGGSSHPQGRQVFARGGMLGEGRNIVGDGGAELVEKHGSSVRVYPNSDPRTQQTLSEWGLNRRGGGPAGGAAVLSTPGKIADVVNIYETSDARATAREVAREQRRRARV